MLERLLEGRRGLGLLQRLGRLEGVWNWLWHRRRLDKHRANKPIDTFWDDLGGGLRLPLCPLQVHKTAQITERSFSVLGCQFVVQMKHLSR